MDGPDARSVLVVDDDPGIREFVASALELEGFSVITARNGAEGLTVAEQAGPCAILLDMRMPVMDGWQFAAAYRERPPPHAPIVVMTAAPDAALWARDVRAEAHLAKPFDIDDLLETIERLC